MGLSIVSVRRTQAASSGSPGRDAAAAGSILVMQVAKAFGAGLDAVRRMVPRFLSIARELGLEIVGFVFLSFGAFFVFGPFGFIQAYRQLPDSFTRLVVSGVGALMFAWFGIDSFRKAKKIARAR